MARNAKAFMVKAEEGFLAREPGACYFVRHADDPEDAGPAGLIHACPCGCGARTVLYFRGRGRGKQEWDVIGEWPVVTLSPSIGVKPKDANGAYHWHGWLRAGVFEEG